MFSKRWSKIVIVTDEVVNSLYGEEVYDSLKCCANELFLITVPASEKAKSREQKEAIEDSLLDKGFDRQSLVVALGGGVVGDLAGFVAATFLRGIDFAIIPTTLLAMVDSSVGGKCGINTPHGKNLLGAIYPPCEVVIHFPFLESLPQREIKSGMMEIIKLALVCDAPLFDQICRRDSLEDLVWRAREIKHEIVSRDLNESGERRLLNFGHTVGHAIERASQYRIPHGEAVWFGMLVESHISWSRGLLPQDEYEIICSFLLQSENSFSWNYDLDWDAVYSAMQIDKKNENNSVRMVLLEGIGKVAKFDGEYCTSVGGEEVLESLYSRGMSEVYSMSK